MGLFASSKQMPSPSLTESLLPNVIADKVQGRGWDPHWRNDLVLEREPKQFSDATRVECPPGQEPRYFQGRFFHIDVRNRHPRQQIATNCYVYLAKADQSKHV